MRIYRTYITIDKSHLDLGNHANWLKLLELAQTVHFQFREAFGIGIKRLMEEFQTFFFMYQVTGVWYFKELHEGDKVDAVLTVWLKGTSRMMNKLELLHQGKVAMRACWIMPLAIKIEGQKPKILPISHWIREIIGNDLPPDEI